jgi:DNA-binding Lrp family transcriptional regulator
MKTKMSANSLSAWEALQATLAQKFAEIINVLRNEPLTAMDSYQIAQRTGVSNGDTKPRLTDLYNAQWIKITGTYIAPNGRVRNLYKLRMPGDPLNIIPKSENDILKEKIEALKWYYGFEAKAVEDLYRKYVEHTMQLKLEI